jgi:DNA-binding transcriptional regulator YiaG
MLYTVKLVDESVRIRVIRAILGITVKEFAERVNVSTHTVTHWEHGHNVPHPKPRKAIAEICRKHRIGIRPDGFPVPVE